MAVWTSRVGWFTGALVLVGIITAVIFSCQLSVMQGQLDEMGLDARAWLAPKDIDRPPSFFMHRDPPYSAATIAFNFINTGKEPATLVNRLIGYKFIDNAWDRAQIGSKIGEILGNRSCKDFSANPAGDTVFPGDQQRLVFGLTADEAKIVLGGGHYLLVGGCLVYQTISEIHWTEICRILDPIDPNVSPGESGFRTIICPTHNHAN